MPALEGRTFPLFGRLFRTREGRQVPADIDLSAPVQAVADTSRMAQWERPGFFRFRQSMTAPIGTNRWSPSARSMLEGLSGDLVPDEYDVWVLGVSLYEDNGTGGLTRCIVALADGLQPGEVDGDHEPLLVAYWSASLLTDSPKAGGSVPYWGYVDGVGILHPALMPGVLPARLRPEPAGSSGGEVFIVVTCTAALQLYLELNCWAGPRGATPPGMG